MPATGRTTILLWPKATRAIDAPALALAVVDVLGHGPDRMLRPMRSNVPANRPDGREQHKEEQDAADAHGFFGSSAGPWLMRSMSLSLSLGSLSFLPNNDKWTYLFGFRRKSSSNRSNSRLALFRLL